MGIIDNAIFASAIRRCVRISIAEKEFYREDLVLEYLIESLSKNPKKIGYLTEEPLIKMAGNYINKNIRLIGIGDGGVTISSQGAISEECIFSISVMNHKWCIKETKIYDSGKILSFIGESTITSRYADRQFMLDKILEAANYYVS